MEGTYVIQPMLGHADLASTQIYTQVAIKQLKLIHEATHPDANLERPETDPDTLATQMNDYLVRNEAGLLVVAGTRVPLAALVHDFWRGETPESLAQSFPTISLEQAYGAITYYRGHRDEVDAEIDALEARSRAQRAESKGTNPGLRARLLAAKDADAPSPRPASAPPV